MLYKSKYNLVPPYQVNNMLLNSPSFNTTHLSEHVIFNKYKYANIKSKYKDTKCYNMNFIFLYYQIFLLLGYNCLQ